MADQDDKQWLFDNGHMPITGGKAFLMIADDIRNLATTHQDYKDNLGIKREDIKGFILPSFMVQKIKTAMNRAALLREVSKKPAAPLTNGGQWCFNCYPSKLRSFANGLKSMMPIVMDCLLFVGVQVGN